MVYKIYRHIGHPTQPNPTQLTRYFFSDIIQLNLFEQFEIKHNRHRPIYKWVEIAYLCEGHNLMMHILCVNKHKSLHTFAISCLQADRSYIQSIYTVTKCKQNTCAVCHVTLVDHYTREWVDFGYALSLIGQINKNKLEGNMSNVSKVSQSVFLTFRSS